ncbi:MAG TPA: OsmC family protein [Virgibacillus sp.]|nr:OsmC family protein [Virgibacillus sp.]
MTEQQLVTLSVEGKVDSGRKNEVRVRDFPPIIVDESERLGGTNDGPNPLEYFLGALSACTSIMASFAAKEQNFTYKDLEYHTEGTLDPRGYQGAEGVQTYFETVKIDVVVDTNESSEALECLRVAVEDRCPLFNLLQDAGVNVISHWSKKEE